MSKRSRLKSPVPPAIMLQPIFGAHDRLEHEQIGLMAELPGALARGGYAAANQRALVSNESRDTEFHYSEPLTQFTVGWRDPENLQGVMAEIAPDVPVGRRFEFKSGTNKEYFLTEGDDIRATGSDFKRVEFTGSSVNSKTLNKGLRIRVDRDEVVGTDWRERYVQYLLQRLWRNELVRTLGIVDASATNANKTWTQGNTSTSNPDKDVRDAVKLGGDASGMNPNRVLYGQLAWNYRYDTYESINTPAAGRAADLSADQVAAKVGTDKVNILRARYQSSATAKTDLLAAAIYAYYLVPGAMKDDPSNFKRFTTPTENGTPFRVWLHEGAKFTDIMVEHYSIIYATSTLGVRKLTVTQA